MQPVTEHEAIKALAARVITSAIEELFLGHPVYRQSAFRKKYIHANTKAQLEAFAFLNSPDFDFWAEAAGIDLNLDIVLTDPKPIKRMLLQQKPRRRKNNE